MIMAAFGVSLIKYSSKDVKFKEWILKLTLFKLFLLKGTAKYT